MVRKKPAISHQPPSCSGGRICRPYSGRGGSSASQGSWRTNWIGIPVHRGQHVETDDLDRDEAAEQRGDAGPAEIDRADLRVADLAEPVVEEARCRGRSQACRVQRHARHRAGLRTCTCVKMFWYSAMIAPLASAPDRQVEPPVPPLRPAVGPERPADDDADRAPEAGGQREEQAEPVDAERADRVADGVAEEGVLVLGVFTASPLARVGRRQDQRAVQRRARASS